MLLPVLPRRLAELPQLQGELTMTTLTRWTAVPFWWFEQIDRWIEEITRFHKARYSAPYH